MEEFQITLTKYDKAIIEIYTEAEVNLLLKKPDKNKCTFMELRNWTICNQYNIYDYQQY